MTAQTNERDLRFDFFRGFALLCICINHTEVGVGLKVLGFLLLNPTGLYDNAMTFVFISGLMYGYVYEKIYLSHGLLMTWARSLVRAVQIYFFQIVLLPFVLGGASLYLLYNNDMELLKHLNLAPYLNGDFFFFVKFILFTHFLLFFDILPLYVLLLIFMPVYLYGLNRIPVLTILIAFFIYVISGLVAYFISVEYLPLHRGTFILSLWQIMFLAGMVLGVRKRMEALRISYSKKYLCPAIVWLLIVFLNEKIKFFVNDYLIEISPTLMQHIPLINRRYLSPVRLLNFFILVYVLSYFVGRNSKIFKTVVGRAIIVCGQHSLEVFSLGVFLSFAGIFLMKALNGGYGSMLMIDIGMVLLSVAFAYYLKWRKREPWRLAPFKT